VLTYPNTDRTCAVTGGYVYRGAAIPDLAGAYVFVDFCDGRLRWLRLRPDGSVDQGSLGPVVDNVASFGEDADGELYVLSLSGTVDRLVPARRDA
jgi:hypothetical protein